MTVFAAAGDTWGISGPDFLAGYLTAAILILVGSIVYRSVVFHGRQSTGFDQLGPQQAAYLNGGDQLAVYSTLGGLRSVGAIGVGPDRRLVPTGSMPAGATPLDQAVYNAAGRRIRSRDLRQDGYVVQALGDLRRSLEDRGLALSAGRRRSARLGAFLLLGLLGIGVLRLFAGLANDRPVALLVVGLVLLAVVTPFQFRAPYRTRAGRRALHNLRRQHHYLSPVAAPAFATYGAAGAAMGVALFGAASLYALDPTFAQEAEIQRQAAASGGATGTSCSGGGSSSSDSGGGSSSSDSGGGSSCGGGGCGGGGCGG